MTTSTADLLRDAARCEQLLADHLAAAVQRFGAAALGVVDLPPLDEPGRASPAQLRAAAALLWARHVDEAGLLDFADALARGVVEGTLHLPVEGDAAAPLVAWWRGREERFDHGERQALYERLFGGAGEPGHPVAALLAALCRALVELGGAEHEGEARRARIRMSSIARELAAELSERAVGITGFAARDIVAQVRQALALLAQPDIAHSLGGLTPWRAIRTWSHLLLGRAIDPSRPVERAQAGLELVQWLAENAAVLEGEGTVDAGDDIIAAAASYGVEASA
ncbi:MAG TPA: hypothetical protein VKB80_27450 [Kofleriaceae bacterium]|nr:hypothetical protein [Kofleriaceae bacterium]